MPRLEIIVIDHLERKGSRQSAGKVIQNYLVYPADLPGPRYADYCALYRIWTFYRSNGNEPEMIGFFGYRKYLLAGSNSLDWEDPNIAPAHAPNWYKCSPKIFDFHREQLSRSDGADIKALLTQHDILQATPFPLNESICEDFARSRSEHDEKRFWNVVADRFTRLHTVRRIHPYLFITRWAVFDRMMRELEPIRQELDPLITAEDSADAAYKQRPMAYVMERVYSLWLENSCLDIHHVPLLHCWDL